MSLAVNADLYLMATIASVSIGAFFIIYFISTKLSRQQTYRILIYILTLFIFFIAYNYLVYSKLIYHTPWFFMFGRHLDILIYLLLLFYFSSFQDGNTLTMKKVHWSLLMSFVFILLVKSPWYHFSPVSDQHRILDLFYSDTRPGPVSIWRVPKFFLLKFAIPLVLLTLSGIQLFRFVYPKLKDKLPRNLLLVSFGLLVLFVLFQNWIYAKLYILFSYSFIEWPVELLVMSFILITLLFYTMKVKDAKPVLAKYKSSSLSGTDSQYHVQRLKSLMENERVYLDPELSLNSLALELKVNTTYLSQAINAELSTRFNDFLNAYRIEEAKLLLKNPDYDKYTIDAIAKKVGFKSVSAFYKAFRRHTGISPNQYKKTGTD